MFIFADESGNTGRAIFDEPLEYHLGAILSTFDPDEVAREVISCAVRAHALDRLHANALTVEANVEIANRLMDAFDAAGSWSFSVSLIEKPYIATTKFVDMIFDTGENGAVPWIWYNNELFRHQLCISVDELLTDNNRRRFWAAFLEADIPTLQECVRNAWTYVARKVDDPRVSRVIRDGFDFFLRNPDEFAIGPRGGRRGYQGQTPNMVAFSCLLRAINGFAEAFHSPPIAFVHDRQDEFKTTMREWYDLFGPMMFDDDERGGWPKVRRVAHELPNLEIQASGASPGLQAVDNLLWVARRRSGETNLESTRQRLRESSDEFFIARFMSELIVFARLQQSANANLSLEDLRRGQRLMREMEEVRLSRLRGAS